MKSKPVASLMADLGVTKSHIRKFTRNNGITEGFQQQDGDDWPASVRLPHL
jgi:hypothetical protein